MSANISIGTDIKDYLNSRDKTSIKSNVSALFTNNKVKNWFYQPLTTEDIDNCDDNQLNQSDNKSRSSTNDWFSSFSLSSNSQNESNQWFPSLVIISYINSSCIQ
jgi:hypothetical protein